MRPILRTPLALATALAVAGGASACRGGDAGEIARLEADLDTQARAQTTLRERIIELEEQLTAVAAPDEDPATAELTTRLDELQAQVDELVRQLEEAGTAREDEQAEVLASLTSLEGSLAELRTRLEEFETEQVRLREDLTLLERRFEDHDH